MPKQIAFKASITADSPEALAAALTEISDRVILGDEYGDGEVFTYAYNFLSTSYEAEDD